jgi:hypothetical protein
VADTIDEYCCRSHSFTEVWKTAIGVVDRVDERVNPCIDSHFGVVLNVHDDDQVGLSLASMKYYSDCDCATI